MRKLCFVNGSPRGNNSSSNNFINELCKIVQNDNHEINHISLNNEVNYSDVDNSDIIVIAFPLYVDTLPSTVIEFLVNLEKYAKDSKNSPRVYSVVNCGFFEGIQNKHAIQIIKNFCDKTGYKWRFGVGIGAGEFMKHTKTSIPLNSEIKHDIYEAFMEIKNDINITSEDIKDNFFLSPKIPKSSFISTGSTHWIEAAKNMSVSEEQLYSRPFLSITK